MTRRPRRPPSAALRGRLHWLLLLLLTAPSASATPTGGSMPWSGPLDILRQDITGPSLTAVVLIGIAFGLGKWALSDDNRGLLRTAKAVIALAAGAGGIVLLTALGISASAL
jgi:type IV secretory pathway VirB2 component (pilin)